MKKRLLAIIATAAMVVTMIPSMAFAANQNPCTDSPCNHEAAIGAAHYDSIEEAIAATAAAGNYEIDVLKNFSGDFIVKQTEGVNIVLDGNNKEFDGTIFIYGSARYNGAETLVIKNFVFKTATAGEIFIDANSTDSDKRYAHNVTVQDCTFEATGATSNVAGLKFRQAYNITIKNCKATKMHSLLQMYSSDGLKADNVEIKECKNGMSVGNTNNIVISNADIDVTGYGVRADADHPRTMTIENSKIDAELPVAIRNAVTTEEYKLNLDDNDFNASNSEGIEVWVTKDADDETAAVAPDAKVTVKEIEEPAPTPEKPDNSPNTGDNSMAPFAVAGLVMAAMAAVVATRRRTN